MSRFNINNYGACPDCFQEGCHNGKVCNPPEPRVRLTIKAPPPTIRCNKCGELKYYFAKQGACLTCANLDDFLGDVWKMSEAIEAMKKEGWIHRGGYHEFDGTKEDIIFFTKPKPKPNAIVDFDALNEKLDLLRREECRLSDVLACIKRA